MKDQNYSRNQKRVSPTAKTQAFSQKKSDGVGEWYPPSRSPQKSANTRGTGSRSSYATSSTPKTRTQVSASPSRKNNAHKPSSSAQQYERMQAAQSHSKGNQYKQPKQPSGIQSRKSIAGSKAIQPRKKIKKSVIAAGVVVLIIVLAIADTLLNWGKIMPGIKVGDLDVGGMTVTEAAAKIESTYSPYITDTEITVYARNGISTDKEAKTFQNELAQAFSAGSEPDDVHYWRITPTELDVGLPADQLANDAYNMARGLSGLPERFLSWFGFARVDVYGSYSPVSIEQLAQEIDQDISDPRVDYWVEIDRGEANVTEGHDGYMVDRSKLEKTINQQFFSSETEKKPGVVFAEYFDVRIDLDTAQKTADFINDAIGDGVVFEYNSTAWMATKSAIGKWVVIDMAQKDDEYFLTVSLNEAMAKAGLLSYIVTNADLEDVNVTFEVSGNNVDVIPDKTGKMPSVGTAVTTLNEALFGENQSDAAKAIDGVAPSIRVEQVNIPEKMTIDTALESGIISKFGTFTTEYAVGTKNIERNYNIHLMADLLNNSVCKANGGVWSFIEVGGPSDEAHGFKSAGTIFQGEHVDSIGGGICQVATTVYNAIYEAGMRIVLRNNHSLYIASYPAGRDATVSWPDMDFKWANDTSSDVLVKMSYTDTTITCDLYGVSPQYTVTSEASDWVETGAYETKYIVNNSRGSGYRQVTTTGQNARSIYVERKVYNPEGTLIIVDQMLSSYDADMEIIEIGPGEFADQMQAEGKVLRIVDSTESS